ncbi:MAG TPA: hypothetical protein DCZ73_11260, partial [Bacteroides sp.]|nr:hypothetical protein [Bacteroides sp.]
MKKIYFLGCLFMMLAVASCYDDKGNYSYNEIPTISIENIEPSYICLRNADLLEITPKITSTIEGEITPDNPNYEYSCRIGNTGGTFDDSQMWHIINPDSTQAFTWLPNEDTGQYICVYTVRDKRTDVATSYQFDLQISSSTYEGWLVLCGEGADNRARLDMVSVIDENRIQVLPDLLGNNELVTSLHNPTQIMFDCSIYANSRYTIYLMTEEGGYKLNTDELTTTAADEVVEGEFLVDLQGDIPIRICPVGKSYFTTYAYLTVTQQGDLYYKDVSTTGSLYEFPVNVSAEGNDGEYVVAPYVGAGQNRPADSYAALLYDSSNQRFMGWDQEKGEGRTCFELPAGTIDPATTGKDLVYMEGTRFSNNTVFSILQDASGNRSIYGINLSGSLFQQQSYIESVQAENFNQAEHFAFNSQFPYMYYSYKDKLYSYNLGTQTLQQTISLPGEEITMVKIDLFKAPNILDVPEDMRAQQYYILVGSYKTGASEDGGILR